MMKVKFLAISAIALSMAMASCSDDEPKQNDETLTAQDAEFKAIAEQYLDNTVIVTYANLAENAAQLVEDLQTLKEARTDANVAKACNSFLAARAWWEKSEAFLYGPASDFGIDPHIDSWPLDLEQLQTEMGNAGHIASLAAEDGDEWAGAFLGPELLGFHGIEYIIFADGQPKSAALIPENEMTYAVAVAGDLRNKTYQLYVSWAGAENVPDEIAGKVEDLELNCTIGDVSYKENMLNAGQAGSTYRTWTNAMQAIVDGCSTIADEVGTQKIGKPYSGEDKNYIESPYSHKSITDFHDNMVSIENAYMGGIEGKRNEQKSLHAYISKVNKELDEKCVAAISDAKTKISQMAAPFVLNYSDPSAKAAADACQAVDDVMREVKSQLSK